MSDFKDEFSPDTVAVLAGELQRAWPQLPADRFIATATDGLLDRKLTGRIALIADALVATMPTRFDHAAAVIQRALEAGGLQGWSSLPVDSFVARAGIDAPDVALPLLADLTSRFSSELALRAFIEAHPDVTFRHLDAWIDHPSEHVRRLVSEGTRPRLPWAPRLRRFIADPTPTIALLDRLYDDESEYVRRSVANHLNDISKDHPELAVETAARWQQSATRGGFVVRHGLRSLVKTGHSGALAVLGFDHDSVVELIELRCEPARIRIGETVTVTFTVRAEHSSKAAIDYLVHYQGVNGRKAGKVFKLAVRDLPAGELVTVERRHTFEHVSIRRIQPGPHRIEIQINGRVLGGGELEIIASR